MRSWVAVGLALGLLGCRSKPSAGHADGGSVNEAFAYLDVRSYGERRRGYIPGSRHVPLGELGSRIAGLDDLRGRPVVTLCAGGARATQAAELLTDAGFGQVSVLDGGMLGWQGPVLARRLDPDGPGYEDRFRVGVSFLVQPGPSDSYPRAGLVVESAYPGADAHGKLRFGDLVTSINGLPFGAWTPCTTV